MSGLFLYISTKKDSRSARPCKKTPVVYPTRYMSFEGCENKSPFSLLWVSSQLARFQCVCCVVLFCDVAGNTGTVRLLVREEAAVVCGEERITKGVGKISKGTQTCNYEKSSGWAFL